jgi:hypothetical protein
MPDPTREELKKAAEHIIALCNKHGISESDESRVVASAFLSAFEREEKIKAIADEWGRHGRLNAFNAMKEIYAAIKADEEGR